MTSRNMTNLGDLHGIFHGDQGNLYLRVFSSEIYKPFIEYVIKYFQENNANRKIYITSTSAADLLWYYSLFPSNSDVFKYGCQLTININSETPILYIHHANKRCDIDEMIRLKQFLYTHRNVKLIYVEEKIRQSFPKYFLYNIFSIYFHFEKKKQSTRRRYRYGLGYWLARRYHFDSNVVPNRTARSIASTYHRQTSSTSTRKKTIRDYACCILLVTDTTLMVKYNERIINASKPKVEAEEENPIDIELDIPEINNDSTYPDLIEI
jgi:hypothetical protein